MSLNRRPVTIEKGTLGTMIEQKGKAFIPPTRQIVMEQIVKAIPHSTSGECIRVGIDGSFCAGKTTFADELAVILSQAGRNAVRCGADHFMNPTSVRWRRGKLSPDGNYYDSFNYERMLSDVLRPLGPGGSRTYRPGSHSQAGAEPITYDPCSGWITATSGAVLIFDGVFLQRPELEGQWDLTIYLDVSVSTIRKRKVARDLHTVPDLDPNGAVVNKFVAAQEKYVALCRPEEKADFVVWNDAFNEPKILKTRRVWHV